MTCLVGHPPIEATPAPAEEPRRRDTSQDTSQEIVFASHLDIQDYSHQDYQPPTLTTDYLLGKTNQMGTHLLRLHQILRRTPFGNQPDYSSIWSSTTTIHVHPSTLGGSKRRCEAAWQPSMPVSWQYYLLYFEFSLCIHCFSQYTKTTETPFTFTLSPIFHRNISPLL